MTVLQALYCSLHCGYIVYHDLGIYEVRVKKRSELSELSYFLNILNNRTKFVEFIYRVFVLEVLLSETDVVHVHFEGSVKLNWIYWSNIDVVNVLCSVSLQSSVFDNL